MWIMKQTPANVRYEHIYDARFAIGFGTADTNVDNVRNMNGEAFINSGHTLDNMKRGERIKCAGYWDNNTNKTLEIYVNTIAEIMNGWTRKQIEVCFEYFTNKENRDVVCETLKLKEASLSQYLKLSHYRLIKQIIIHSEKIIGSQIC